MLLDHKSLGSVMSIHAAIRSALCFWVALTCLLSGAPANANLITIFKEDGTTVAGTVTDGSATNTFEGFTAPGVLSFTSAITSPQQSNSNPTTEATLMNTYAGTSFVSSIQGPSDPSNPLPITGTYFMLKLDGPNTGWALFKNDSGGPLSLTYTEVGTASGLSHVSTFAAAVPGPIVGAGLPGLLAACGGLLALARRRRQKFA